MTLQEKRRLEHQELQERREKELAEIQQQLRDSLTNELIEVLAIKENTEDWSYTVTLAFTLDGYRQEDEFYWSSDKSQEDFIARVGDRIEYVKELREKYTEYCKQNDFIQANSKFCKIIKLTHMGYPREFSLNIQLADYMKLPNTTSYSCGGGDYQIKRTPKRLEEYNKNIDIAIDKLLDCISELKQRKYISR